MFCLHLLLGLVLVLAPKDKLMKIGQHYVDEILWNHCYTKHIEGILCFLFIRFSVSALKPSFFIVLPVKRQPLIKTYTYVLVLCGNHFIKNMSKFEKNCNLRKPAGNAQSPCQDADFAKNSKSVLTP